MITFRFADRNDVDKYFAWANDPIVRSNSYTSKPISYLDHVQWFNHKIDSDDCYLYFFLENDSIPVGQVRIEIIDGLAYVGVSIAAECRGRGLSKEIIKCASDDFLMKHPDLSILAYVFKTNSQSYQSFCKSGFVLLREEVYKNIPSYILKKSNW